MRDYNEIKYNYHEYSNKEIYITVGINVGIATRYYLIDKKNIFLNNLAFANIFVNYLKFLFGDKYLFDVDRTSVTITRIGHTDTMGDDILTTIKDIYMVEISNKKFEMVKRNTIDNFIKVYKDGMFRGWYKAFEVSELNKGFLLKQLIDDLQNITYERFVECFENLITLYNSSLYINGNIRDLTTEEVEDLKIMFAVDKNQAILGGQNIDPYLRGDAHLLEVARETSNIDVLNFSFDSKVGLMDKLVYLEIESEKVPFQDKVLHMDEFDSSLIVNEGELMKLKNFYKKIVTEDQFKSSQATILGRYLNWLKKEPKRFGKQYVEFMLSGVSIVEYLNILSELIYSDYATIANQIKPIVTEAQIVMRR